jgi:hypothetical protein
MRRPPAGASGLVGTYLTAAASDTNGTEFTFSGLNFGTAAADRTLVVGFVGVAAPAAAVVSVTIGGVAATQVVGTSLTQPDAGIWRAAVPTGTSGNVVVTYATSATRVGVALWSVYGTIASASSGATNGGPTTLNRTVTGASGGFIVCVAANDAGAFAWTNATERFDGTVGGFLGVFTAADATTVGSTTITVTGSSGNLALAVAAFSP